MNCFQLVKKVLDETYAKIPGTASSRKDAVKRALRHLAGEYARFMRGVNIDYEDPAVRFAYVYNYVTSHTCIVYDAISLCDELRALFNKPRVTVSCIGGGPGSDFLGVIRYVTNHNLEPRLRFNVFDRERAWGNTWDYVEEKITPDLTLAVSTGYYQLDITDETTWRSYDKFLGSDLFTMIYFMSEVYSLRDQARPFFDYFWGGASKGALALYVDNHVKELSDLFDELAANHGWKLVLRESFTAQAPSDEEKGDLGEYLGLFDWTPKLQANIDLRVVRKM